MIRFEFIGTHKGSCMSCGNETIRYMDTDGSEFCKKACVFDWHGDDIKETVTNCK